MGQHDNVPEEGVPFLSAPNDDSNPDPRPAATSRASIGSRLGRWLRSRSRKVRRLFRWHGSNPFFSTVKYAAMFLLVILVGTPLLAPSYSNPPIHYRELAARCEGPTAEPGCANPFQEKVFIAVSLYDNTGYLAGGSWGKSLLEVIHLIGEDNVFLSIYENDSGPKGEQALRYLQGKVRCRHKIFNDAHVSLSDFPTVEMPDGTDRVKRLTYLSEIRNRALRPLDKFDVMKGAVKYDKILFLNDIAFHPIDAAQLLFSTNVGPDGRAHYLTACGLDYRNPVLYYDLYAMRDAEGYSGGLPIFPFYSNAGHGISRAGVIAERDAVPVSSCWSGIVAMQAEYVQNTNATLPNPQFQDIGAHVIDPKAPEKVTSPVRFRSEPEIFFDACECCLFLADVAQVAKRQGGRELRTFVNPYVRVAYAGSTLVWAKWFQKWERLFVLPQRIITWLTGLPRHNPHRTVKEGDGFMEEIWTGKGVEGKWELVKRQARNAMFCGVREMQVLQLETRTEDVNWENSGIPPGQTLNFPN